MRQWIGSQCSSIRLSLTWSRGPRLKISRAAAFWTRCNTLRVDCGTPANRVAVVQSGGDECKHKPNRDFRAYATANLAKSTQMVETRSGNL